MDHRGATILDVSKLRKSDSLLPERRQEVTVLFVNVTHLSPNLQFFVCCVAVFILYVIYGYLQELIFTQEGFKPYGWYLTLVQFAMYTVMAYAETRTLSTSKRRIPLKTYALLALLTLGTMGFSNSSLSYLNYPMQVIFKCCKLIPVMIGSILIQRKKYKLVDFIAAFFMCAGLSYFTLADSQISPNFSLVGVAMISCALLCDAAIGNVQEKSMKTYAASNTEVVLYSYSIGLLYLFVVMLFTGDFWNGVVFCADKPQMYGYAFLFSLSGYLGVNVVLTLVRTCGALAAVTVTTCRKAVSIIISFIFFSKPFTIQYLWAGLLVVLGIYLNLMSKNQTLSSKFGSWMETLKKPLGSWSYSYKRIRTIETTV
ncbi:hypothetical protein GE061_003738 [Apolygus lucorum]|uniref:Adenosine 3'-phospho 5'-phosphosulfate transporter 2 n=1 Tax=Apolygus lucorum TaxID=248454 RepID=A0A6A4JQI5_APOLU|nr:hypothetical protein GE061_003738 [Apolygus lucorum]